jgi:hypothetical protein
VLLLPHSLIKVPQDQPRFIRAIFYLSQFGPHVMPIGSFWLSVDEGTSPHMIIEATANMHVDMPFAEGEELNSNILRPVECNAAAFPITLNLEAVFHAKSKSKIFHSFFTLPSLTYEN